MSLKSEAAKPVLSGKRSPVTAWFSSSFLRTPIWLLKSVMMQGVLLFGVSWSVFLSHPERQYGVSEKFARLLTSCGLGGQYITIAVRSSCQFRSLHGSRSSLQLRRCTERSYHVPRLPFFAHKDGHSWQTCSRIVSAHAPISLRSAAHAEQR